MDSPATADGSAPVSVARDASDRGLLLVDDEPYVLNALERLFRDEGYTVLKAPSGDAALELLTTHPVGVIISDERMPEMSGSELLSRIRELYPDSVRIVLTGHTELEAVMEAVNRGAIYKFLVKPWDPLALKASVEEAFQQHHLILERRRVKEEIERANAELVTINDALNERIADKSRQLVEITQYDSLTKLPNRILFMDRLQQAILQSQQSGGHVAVLVLGLDRFKLVNESFGHAVGDQLLNMVAQRLAQTIKKSDTVSRLSGDEFGIITGSLKGPVGAARVAQRILDALSEPFQIMSRKLFAVGSIGSSVYPIDAIKADRLMQHAATALHHAKKNRGNRHEFFAREMNVAAEERLHIENDLRGALERDEFVLYYQPQIDLGDGGIAGVEALLRWRHPVTGLVGPDRFIPVLEDTGLIQPVGEWVLRTACAQVRRWQEAGLGTCRVAVNLSVRQLQHHDIVERVRAIVAESGIDPLSDVLEFEVTESLVADNVEQAIAILEELADIGIRIAMDDFGTGYASLSYLTRLPIHSVKIDRSFINRIHLGGSDSAVVHAIITMAHTLGYKVIAEGVETNEQLEFLRDHGCDQIQGFLVSKPQPAEEITELLRADGRASNP